MKKSLTRKLTIAVIALVFAVVSLSTSTYAWFTMSDTANVDAFTADVQAAEGIEIAVTSHGDWQKADFYTGNIPTGTVQAVITELATENNGYSFETFEALTTKNGVDFYGTEIKDGKTVQSTTAAKAGYVSFYVHIRAAKDGNINVDEVEFTTKTESQAPWVPGVAYELEGDAADTDNVLATDSVTYAVSNAARISFVDSTKASKGIYEADEADFAKEGTAWTAGNTVGTTNTFGAFDVFNQKNVDAPLAELNAKQYEAEQVKELKDVDGQPKNVAFIEEVEANEVQTIEVKVWIEGYDAECINAIFAQTLSVSFKLAWTE